LPFAGGANGAGRLAGLAADELREVRGRTEAKAQGDLLDLRFG
jgi:hypothetical protein